MKQTIPDDSVVDQIKVEIDRLLADSSLSEAQKLELLRQALVLLNEGR
jgi:hypothetical protein